jgi:hypothetical protein
MAFSPTPFLEPPIVVRIRPLDGRKDTGVGNSFTLCPGEEQQIVYAETFACDTPEPLLVNLALDVHGPPCPIPDAMIWPHVRGELSWTLGAVRFEAEFDVIDGMCISVTANTIKVRARYLVESPPWEPRPDPQDLPAIVVTGGLGYGCGVWPQLTELAQVRQAGDSCIVPVPRYARTFTVLPVNDSKVAVRVMPLGGGYGVNARIGVPLTNVDQYNAQDAISLFDGAQFVEVTNRNQTGPAFAFLVFELSLR